MRLGVGLGSSVKSNTSQSKGTAGMMRTLFAEGITLRGVGAGRVLVSAVLARDTWLVCGAASFGGAVFLAEPEGADTSMGLAGEEGAARSLAISCVVSSCCASPPIGPVEKLTASGSLTVGRAGAVLCDCCVGRVGMGRLLVSFLLGSWDA